MVVTEELEVELTELKLHGELQMDLYEAVGQRSGQGSTAQAYPHGNLPTSSLPTHLVYTV